MEEIKKIMRNLDKNDNGYMDYTGILLIIIRIHDGLLRLAKNSY